MNNLQTAIGLAQQCIAARARGDRREQRRMAKERDDVRRELDAFESHAFNDWRRGEFTPEQVAAFLASGDRRDMSVTRSLAREFAGVAETVRADVEAGRMDAAAELYGEMQNGISREVVHEVDRGACSLEFSRAVADRIGAERCRQLHEAMYLACVRWLHEHEPLMSAEQLAVARAAVEQLKANGWAVPARAAA